MIERDFNCSLSIYSFDTIMNTYLLLFLVHVVLAYVYNYTDFINTIKGNIAKYLTGNYNEKWSFKPFTCDLCMSFWITLILVLCINITNIYLYFYCVLLSFLHPRIVDVLGILDRWGSRVMMWIDMQINN